MLRSVLLWYVHNLCKTVIKCIIWSEEESMSQQERIAITVGMAAPDITLRDADGVERALSEFWTERPTALVFVRHFG